MSSLDWFPLSSAKRDVQDAMKEGGRGFTGTRRRVGGLLVTAEVALSLVLLAGAGLLIRSFIRLQDLNPGFVPEHLLTLHVGPSDKAHDPVRFGELLSRDHRARARFARSTGGRCCHSITHQHAGNSLCFDDRW